MRKIQLFSFLLFLVYSHLCLSQIVKIEPADAKADEEVKVIFDATEGTADLTGVSSVYMHSGIITDGPDGTDWQYVIGNWGQDDGIGKMEPVEGSDNLWEISLSPSIRSYYEAPDGINIFRLAMVFRSEDGSSEGKGSPGDFEGGFVASNGDIFVDLNVGNFISFTQPSQQDVFVTQGSSFDIQVAGNAVADQIQIFVAESEGDFQLIEEASDVEELQTSFSPSSSGTIQLRAQATYGQETVDETISRNIILRQEGQTLSLPSGLLQGINYHDNDETKVTLVLVAPEKEFVYLVGDFTDWTIDDDYLMNRDPDGETYWIEIDNLEPGKEYVFQYWVDGVIKVGDPYADKVVDPWNDEFIPEEVYPNLIEYRRREHGIATVLQTAQEPYQWSANEANWERPDPSELVIYELLIRDFVGSHSYNDLIDTLSYLKRLGVNTIELLPIKEFEGNISWGYNPSYFFAVDKYYGTRDDLKRFIDVCHQEGFAVVLDMVMNHAFGQNSWVRMYWDEVNNRPAANSPWFNQIPKHPFNVGYDFNHESSYTKFVLDSVNRYWMEQYHFDGYRFDLSKGFTQNDTGDDVAAWSAYDQSRIDILDRMAQKLWSFDEGAYVILEHFADRSEEEVLGEKGMYLWGNRTYSYGDAVTGNFDGNFGGTNHPEYVYYMESHDEQRLMYKALQEGRSQGTYDIKNPSIGYNRVKMASSFFYTVPGPKMMWMFQELGYDIDINFNGRTGPKPLVWGSEGNGYYEDEERQKLYKAHAAIINLIRNHEAFHTGEFSWKPNGQVRRINIRHDDLDVTIIGNFGLTPTSIDPRFSKTGTWYDFFNEGETWEINDVNEEIELLAGEFHIFTDRPVDFPEAGLVQVFKSIVSTDPVEFTASEAVEIIFDPGAANGFDGVDPVYMVSGVVLEGGSSTMLEATKGGSSGDVEEARMTQREDGKWSITITPREYFNIPSDQRVFRLGVYFRDETGEIVAENEGGGPIFLTVRPEAEFRAVWTDPEVFGGSTNVRIYFDATAADPAGTSGLVGVDKVYMHAGVIVESEESTSWEYVVGNWGQDDGVGEMERVEGEQDVWSIQLRPRAYFDVPAEEVIYRLGMVFRNAEGNREGKDEGGRDFFINLGTPTSTPSLSPELNVFPNPANQHLKVRIQNIQQGGDLTLRLIDTTGRMHFSENKRLSGNEEWEIPVNRLPNGLYILQIQHPEFNKTEKILIQH